MKARLKLNKLYSFLSEVELSPLQQAYQEFFKNEMDKFGNEIGKDCGSPADLTDEECSEFFTRIKQGWSEKKQELDDTLTEHKLRKVIRKMIVNEATNTSNANLDGSNNSARYVPPGQRNKVNIIQLGGWEQVEEGPVADNPLPDDHNAPDGPKPWAGVGKSAKMNNKIVRKGADLTIMSEIIRNYVRKVIREEKLIR